MLRKSRLRDKNDFLIKKNLVNKKKQKQIWLVSPNDWRENFS